MNLKVEPLMEKHLHAFWNIVVMAGCDGYHPQNRESRIKWFKQIMDECEELTYYGAWKNEKLYGGMAIIHSTVNIRNSIQAISGVGMVHTDMIHKKEKVCKTMIKYFLESSVAQGHCITYLSPFRPDFYKKMGFGYGAPLYQYRLKPEWFPNKGDKSNLSFLDENSAAEYLSLCAKRFKRTHGEVNKNNFFTPFAIQGGKRILVYQKGQDITGLLLFSFEGDKQLVIDDLIYEEEDALYGICSFLNSQSDQVNFIQYNTPDSQFYYLLNCITDDLNSLNIATAAMNCMYRIINTKGLFEASKSVNFNHQSIEIAFDIEDDFLQSNNGRIIVRFEKGYPVVRPDTSNTFSLAVKMHVSEFTSLFMGVISASELYRLGLLKISDTDALQTLDLLFTIPHKPLCTTHI